MSTVAAFAEAVLSLGGEGIELDRRTPYSPVALRVRMPNRLAVETAAVVARRLGIVHHKPIKENPHTNSDGRYQMVLHLSDSQVAEAVEYLRRNELPEGPRAIES